MTTEMDNDDAIEIIEQMILRLRKDAHLYRRWATGYWYYRSRRNGRAIEVLRIVLAALRKDES